MKGIGIMILILGSSLSMCSQHISMITPSDIKWISNGEELSLKTAVNNGIFLPEEISLELYFDRKELARYDFSELNFDFEWYYYSSTELEYVTTYSVFSEQIEFQRNGTYLISSTYSALKKGWWEVKIVARIDEGLIEFGNMSKFQIFIK